MESVGYDARISESVLPKYWDESRKNVYLARNDVSSPYSVDPIVWPSIFDYEYLAIGMDKEYREQMGLTGYPLKEWIGPNPPFWSSFHELDQYVNQVASNEKFVFIAAYKHVLISHNTIEQIESDKDIEKNGHLLFQGFDVVAEGFISGISNCGLDGDAKASHMQWGSRLNKHHLFDEITYAFEYKEFIDEAVIEHAPFDIYSVWIVEKR